MKKILTGKVREVFETNDNDLIIVTTDRISSFDVILGSEIPGKGIVLNNITNFWLDYTKHIVPNHLISTTLGDMPDEIKNNPQRYEGRTVKVKKLNMLPYEIIVRGYVFGSMWKAYSKGELFCGHKIEGDYQLAEKLAKPIVTPSIKAQEGHDIYISKEEMASDIGDELAQKLCDISLEIYNTCYQYAIERGVIIADTKFEFGIDEYGNLTLADEVLTPDSSRFWNKDTYKVGESPASYDKQFVRDWLIKEGLDGKEPAPELPKDIIDATSVLYKECQDKLLG